MKTTEIKNIVSYVLGLFDTLVLLVAWPEKGFDHSLVHFRLRRSEQSYGRNPVPTSSTWRPRT